jgi:uncharacterized membrane protein YqaE (UPF0057 family)
MNRPQQFTKVDLRPRKHHGYAVLLFIFGTLFPPLAVAARFGFNGDFWLNLLLTVCGYIPGHGHNFYIQNIRNNKNHRRTPKWAIRYGLVDDSEIRRKAKRSQWASRYNERLPNSTLEGQEFEEGQIPDANTQSGSGPAGSQQNNLWTEGDEGYYRDNGSGSLRSGDSGSGGRWHYPANFEDADVPETPKKKKKDRWARAEDARRGVDDDGGSRRRRKKKSSKKKPDSDFVEDRAPSMDDNREGPEDAVGGLYGSRSNTQSAADTAPPRTADRQDEFSHQF